MEARSLPGSMGRRHRWIFGAIFLVIIIYTFYPSDQPTLGLVFTKSSFDWSQVEPHYPPSQPLHTLPAGTVKPLPRVQYTFPRRLKALDSTNKQRRDAVRAAFVKCWKNYEQYAWMRDELAPLTAAGKDTFGGWAATLVDSLDTLWIMGLKEEFKTAVRAVAQLDWSKTSETAVSMFETTIRHLGGLLSAYDLSGEHVLLDKAIELGDMLYAGFDTPNRMPPFWFNFVNAKQGTLRPDNHQPSASAASLSMEFTRLAQLTGDNKYYDAVAYVTDKLYETQNQTRLPGVWPTFFDLLNGNFVGDNSFTLGALADSMYEYVLKMHPLLGGLEPQYEQMYRTMTKVIEEEMLFRPMTPENNDILFSGTVRIVDSHAELDTEGQHLGCFVGGMFALGGRVFNDLHHIDLGARITNGCVWAYSAFPTGIMPEIFSLVKCPTHNGCPWDQEEWLRAVSADSDGSPSLPRGFRNAREPKYILRPEALESVFIMYRITGEEQYREAAWKMFQAIQAATETPYGNAAIDNVTVTGQPTQRDSMESFWMAETLKYLYLTFSTPDVISLDEYVFNTEAHPFRLPT